MTNPIQQALDELNEAEQMQEWMTLQGFWPCMLRANLQFIGKCRARYTQLCNDNTERK